MTPDWKGTYKSRTSGKGAKALSFDVVMVKERHTETNKYQSLSALRGPLVEVQVRYQCLVLIRTQHKFSHTNPSVDVNLAKFSFEQFQAFVGLMKVNARNTKRQRRVNGAGEGKY